MEVKRHVPYERPLPDPDAVAAPFWQAAAEGELRIQRCDACGRRQFYPRAVCLVCGATPGWETASGHGTVHTFTVIRQYGQAPFSNELPYVVAMIELDEGVHMMGNVTDCDPERVHIGMPVEAYAVLAEEETGVVFWRPAARTRS